ncbi:hypothetical protein JAAARDRAFT_182095 [Jaapia argillacea MUCL 33604]|uniref:SUI1 domain-containing protein n=1 Tax=Jaapia argillacea MUCL 33604 TaxID=933084 RepID=A0A067PTH6_9AGAM|nr:hypothetical protein JAAARDRAFT_182095 [Jaapia argillacea MUCL 33604]
MFKKPLADVKTSAPLRSSDRRKLKQRVVQTYSLSSEDGELLVPDGLKSLKFSTYAAQPGIVYLASDGDPLWFSLGKGSDELIPTVYTLWKKPDLLPSLSTPGAVIPKLVDGADLMIPGVATFATPLRQEQLVSICQYDPQKRSFPLAIGRMAVSDATLRANGAKGKGVLVWHTWKDALWNLGKGGEPPEPVDPSDAVEEIVGEVDEEATPPPPNESPSPIPAPDSHEVPPAESSSRAGGPTLGTEQQHEAQEKTLTAEEISEILQNALIQSILFLASNPLPPSSFPMPSTTFYTSHILPYRPAHLLLSTSQPQADIKHSSFKSLSAFLKSSEKSGLLTLKNQKSDVMVASVNITHPAVQAATKYKTMKDVEDKEKKKKDKEKDEERKRPAVHLEVREYLKPWQTTVDWFRAAKADTTALYELTDVRALLNSYVSGKDLVNQHQQQFINVSDDPVLSRVVTSKSSSSKGKGKQEDPIVDTEFMKREDIVKKLSERMQPWYELRVGGKDGVPKKGSLQPVQVIMKTRQNRKAVTLITGLEPFSEAVGTADDVADEVRKFGFGTSVSEVPNKPTAHEIQVQGKQMKPVTDLLLAKGVPKKWIEVQDQTK